MIRACCFDMDGVLFDTERAGTLLMSMALAEQGYDAAPESWISLIGTTMQQTGEALEQRFPGISVSRFLDDWKNQTMRWAFTEGLPVKPGAAETLLGLRERGIGTALCSSNDPEVVLAYLRAMGWEELFQHVVTVEQVENAKPHPDIYLEAARRLGVDPACCAGVEDSPSGLRALRAAGFHSIMIPDMIPCGPELAPYVDCLLPSMEDLLAYIDRLNQGGDHP